MCWRRKWITSLAARFLGRHPRVHFLRQHIERHRAAAQDDVVEFLDREFRSESGLRPLCQLAGAHHHKADAGGNPRHRSILQQLGYKEGTIQARIEKLNVTLNPLAEPDPRLMLVAKVEALVHDAERRSERRVHQTDQPPDMTAWPRTPTTCQ